MWAWDPFVSTVARSWWSTWLCSYLWLAACCLCLWSSPCWGPALPTRASCRGPPQTRLQTWRSRSVSGTLVASRCGTDGLKELFCQAVGVGGGSSGVLGSELSSLLSVHSRSNILTIVVFFLLLVTMCLVTIGVQNTHQYRGREVVLGHLKGPRGVRSIPYSIIQIYFSKFISITLQMHIITYNISWMQARTEYTTTAHADNTFCLAKKVNNNAKKKKW